MFVSLIFPIVSPLGFLFFIPVIQVFVVFPTIFHMILINVKPEKEAVP
ncbi:hypothetical protein MmTuc01_1242 [Methanosarcina mazei Tuc01]|uniref:Uncharacterized protein n=1 Tax=Methanosarcina mazei Tuc01 TaxID=1236903 RepID=M1QI37_METMZ|nr:hypothetical protein MmTuc01_1242 [Methanosarcina mazei Tuc01]